MFCYNSNGVETTQHGSSPACLVTQAKVGYSSSTTGDDGRETQNNRQRSAGSPNVGRVHGRTLARVTGTYELSKHTSVTTKRKQSAYVKGKQPPKNCAPFYPAQEPITKQNVYTHAQHNIGHTSDTFNETTLNYTGGVMRRGTACQSTKASQPTYRDDNVHL